MANPLSSARVNLPTVTGDQQTLLQRVFDFFHEGSPWPTFGQLDREFRRKEINLPDVLRTLHRAYGWFDRGQLLDPRPDMELALTVFGVAHCQGSEGDLKLFFEALQWLVGIEGEHVPQPDGAPASPVATAEGFRQQLLALHAKASAADVRKIGMLLRHEPPGGVSGGSGGIAGDWTATLRRDVWKYRSVEDLSGYVEIVRQVAPRLYGFDQPSTPGSAGAAETRSSTAADSESPSDEANAFVTEYRLRYAGSAGRPSDLAIPGHLVEIVESSGTKTVCLDGTLPLCLALKGGVVDPLALILRGGVVTLEDQLAHGRGLHNIGHGVRLLEKDHQRLVELDSSDKQCAWQSGQRRRLICDAARDERVRATTIAECRACPVPDERWACVNFAHPEIVDTGTLSSPHARSLVDARCEVGKGPAGSECLTGGKPCWERVVNRVEKSASTIGTRLVEPGRPFSNRLHLQRLIREAQGCLRWYERDMPPKVLELLGEEIAYTQASEIRLLSGDLAHRSPTSRGQAQRALRDFCREYDGLGVRVSWRELLKGDVPHDRVVIDDRVSFNVPPVNTVLKGDASEITVSSLKGAWFDALWEEATPLVS